MVDMFYESGKFYKFITSHHYIVSFLIIIVALVIGGIFANNNFVVVNPESLVEKYKIFDNLQIYRGDYYKIGFGGQLYTFLDKNFNKNQYSEFVLLSGQELVKNSLPGDFVYFFKTPGEDSLVSFVIHDKGKEWFFLSPYSNRTGIKSDLISFFQKGYHRFELYLSGDELKALYEKKQTGVLLSDLIRIQYIENLVSNGFTGFIARPFPTSGYQVSRSGYEYDINSIYKKDDVDLLIQDQLKKNFIGNIFYPDKGIFLSSKSIFSGIYLFKTKSDLDVLGYQIVSFRSRENNDLLYRRHNIYTAFKNIGNVVVVNPGDEISFMKSIDFDRKKKKNYMNGKVIVGNNIINAYGGGVCGASTAIYQGILTNKALSVVSRVPHSKRVGRLYKANINDEFMYIPGIDSTVYYEGADFVFKNISTHPIVLFLLYSGEEGGVEEVFTLGKSDDKGTLVYNKKFSKGTFSCYSRNINGTDVSSCYKSIE